MAETGDQGFWWKHWWLCWESEAWRNTPEKAGLCWRSRISLGPVSITLRCSLHGDATSCHTHQVASGGR